MKYIPIVSDLHVGDYSGLWHPDYVLEGGTWKSNKWQRYLYRIYQDLLEWFGGYSSWFDAVFVNGDGTAGENPAERGARLVTGNLGYQGESAAMLLDPLRQLTDKFFVIRGTPYHEGKKVEGAETIGKDLDAMKWPDGRYSGMWFTGLVEGTNVMLDIAHAIPHRLVYTTTGLEREGAWSRMDKRGKGVARKHIVGVRSHGHTYALTETLTDTYENLWVETPCFQIQGPHPMKTSPNKLVPDLGGILIEIDEEAEENGVRILKRTYRHPKKEIVLI